MRKKATVAGPALFTFGIIADTHMNPRDGESSSPWVTNKLANERSSQVIEDLNRTDPAFVVHLGDIIHPVPASPGFADAAARFNELFSRLNPDLHLVPGNHDVGDKPLEWMPAATIRDDYIEQYRAHFGSDYFSFEHEDCGFVVINCQVLNSGLAHEREQEEWLERTLREMDTKRIFVFSHYPPFITFANEGGHYDNIDEPGRSWLLDLLDRHRVEALFTGHVHNFFYNRYRNLDIYVLPSLSFVRQDYSEMFHAPPVGEYGRDDRAKLGYMLVTVHESGHVPDVIRTYGRTVDNDSSSEGGSESFWPRSHVRRHKTCQVGVDLRHSWCELTQIPYTGAVDEFSRKWARNDYVLLALWEAGINRLRVPASDLQSPSTRERMMDFVDNGHEFTVFTFGAPRKPILDLARSYGDLVNRWEVVLADHNWKSDLVSSGDLCEVVVRPPLFSKLRTSANTAGDGSRFNHFINHGFTTSEIPLLEKAFESSPRVAGRRPGVVFRVGYDASPCESMELISGFVSDTGLDACAHIRFAHDNPAEESLKETALINRLCRTLCAAWKFPDVEIFVDTFQSHDRGYFPRMGILDRACNPTRVGGVFRRLSSILTAAAVQEKREWDVRRTKTVEVNWLRAGDWSCALFLAAGDECVESVPAHPGLEAGGGEGALLDLCSGRIRLIDWTLEVDDGRRIRFAHPFNITGSLVFLPRWMP